jgi:hypothetical protein
MMLGKVLVTNEDGTMPGETAAADGGEVMSTSVIERPRG